MPVVEILGVVILLLIPWVSGLPLALPLFAQSAQTSQTPDTSATPPASTTAPASAAPIKPCPAPSGSSTSSPNTDCKPAARSKTKPKKHNPTPQAGTPPDSPAKTVVRNGSTTDPEVELSPGLSPQQVSQQIKNTDQLLASTDANLKVISTRQLSATQQDTLTQIKSFMEQARAASSSGDVQRAYNLANKANMLSADLKGH
jgi:hypothetical protein